MHGNFGAKKMAKGKKAKTLPNHPFSIFLLKADFTADNTLSDNHKLEQVEATNLPAGAVLYILDAEPKEPWWKGYFDVQKDKLRQVQKGALVFLPVNGRWFALSFGHVYHHMKENAYEYDFGLLVTLNCINPKEVKSADMVAPGAARRKRTQVPNTTDLTYLDFDSNSEIIKSLTGSVKKKYADLFKNATGSTALKVGLKLAPEQLPNFCAEVYNLYDSDDYTQSFRNINNITPVKDPDEIKSLDAQLLELFRDKDATLTLSIPDIVDYRDNVCLMFHADGRWSEIYTDPVIESFYKFLGDAYDFAGATIDKLKEMRMVLTDADGTPTTPYSIYRSLLADINDADGNVFHLCEGKWYRFKSSFIDQLQEYIDAKCSDSTLPNYNHDVEKDGVSTYSEENYNKDIGGGNGYICLDREDIRPEGATEIEPCDLYKVENGRAQLHHIKISTRSSQLSHLFNQGVNSIELLKGNKVSQGKLKALVQKKIGLNDLVSYVEPIDNRKYEVIFGIITRANKNDKSSNLPLFSQISLKRNMERLDLMEIPNRLIFIGDDSPNKESHPKYPSITVEVFDSGDGKSVVRPIDGQAGFDPALTIKRVKQEIKDSPIGSRFSIMVKVGENGSLSSHHSWPYQQV